MTVKFLRIGFCCTLVFTMIIACQNNQAEQDDMTNEQPITVKQSYDNDKKELSSDEIAKHLVDIATSVPDVNDATAVIAGNYAVVGIDVNDKLDRSRVGSIKYSVAEALSDDPYGAQAVVTADADTLERLREMADHIRQGRPIGGILEELASIAGRLMPEVPGEINEDQTDPTETNDQQLPNDSENKLEKNQQEQGKMKQNKVSE
jgi:YhcN/YlaJ family sporulation lipoprotein